MNKKFIIEITEEDSRLIHSALNAKAFKKAEIAIKLQLPNTEGPKYILCKDKIMKQIIEQLKDENT